jgi:hypothetical protein
MRMPFTDEMRLALAKVEYIEFDNRLAGFVEVLIRSSPVMDPEPRMSNYLVIRVTENSEVAVQAWKVK